MASKDDRPSPEQQLEAAFSISHALSNRLELANADIEAIGDELKAIGIVQKDLLRSRDEAEAARTVANALVRHFGAYFARVWLVKPGDSCSTCQLAEHCPDKYECLHLSASSGYYTHTNGPHARVPLGSFKIGLIAQGRGKTISNDVVHDERVHNRDWAAEHGLQAFAGFPIQVEDRVVGVMAMFSKSTLPGHLLTTLELLADLTASALENVRHFQLEAELARARKLESVGQLAAGVAHEINSPMQFISDNIEFIDECTTKLFALLDGYDRAMGDMEHPVGWEARQREIANLIHDGQLEYIRDEMPQAVAESRQGIRRVLDIVRAMRQFSHPGTKEMVETDLNEAVQNALIISKNRWKNVADVETALDPELAHVPALITEIGQVFLNLVVNAADAISDQIGPEPDAKGRISIRSHHEGEFAIVEVKDTGCGIPESLRTRIFDPFFTTKEVGKGTGQGLTFCHDVVVNQHHGLIELDSTPGVGTCFRVKLPRTATAPEQAIINA